jgi:hypothetical protein
LEKLGTNRHPNRELDRQAAILKSKKLQRFHGGKGHTFPFAILILIMLALIGRSAGSRPRFLAAQTRQAHSPIKPTAAAPLREVAALGKVAITSVLRTAQKNDARRRRSPTDVIGLTPGTKPAAKLLPTWCRT